MRQCERAPGRLKNISPGSHLVSCLRWMLYVLLTEQSLSYVVFVAMSWGLSLSLQNATLQVMTPAYFDELVDKFNTANPFGFLQLEGVHNAKVPTPEYWQILNSEKDERPDQNDLYTFFDILHGPAVDPQQGIDQVSEFYELIIVPHLGSATVTGFAKVRGEYGTYAPEDNLPTQTIFLSHYGMRRGSESLYATLVHEIGHTLGLLHTFKDTDKFTSTSTSVDGSCPICTPSEAKSQFTGDFISDTKPTLTTGKSFDALLDEEAGLLACTKTFDTSGLCIDAMEKDTMTNYMSYDDTECKSRLTPMQLARARCLLDQDFGSKILTMPPAIVPFTISDPAITIELSWLPPVSAFWCVPFDKCIKEYRIERRENFFTAIR